MHPCAVGTSVLLRSSVPIYASFTTSWDTDVELDAFVYVKHISHVVNSLFNFISNSSIFLWLSTVSHEWIEINSFRQNVFTLQISQSYSAVDFFLRQLRKQRKRRRERPRDKSRYKMNEGEEKKRNQEIMKGENQRHIPMDRPVHRTAHISNECWRSRRRMEVERPPVHPDCRRPIKISQIVVAALAWYSSDSLAPFVHRQLFLLPNKTHHVGLSRTLVNR